jgi:two-component system sensor histidine kinase BaeS
MNRLWVRLSLVIGIAVIFVGVLPFVYREIFVKPFLERPPAFPPLTDQFQIPDISQEQLQTYSKALEERLWQNAARQLLIGGLIAIGIGILLSRWLTRPLSHLEAGAQAVAAGKLEQRIPVVGSREERSVAEAFNLMTSKLSHQEMLRSNLLADVSHELRHPVHLLRGSLQAILDGVYQLEMPEIARLLDQTYLLARLVDDLHDIAQVEANKLPLYKQSAELTRLVSDTVSLYQPQAVQQQVSLVRNLPSNAINREVDAGRLCQVIQNLLINALQHTPPEGQILVALSEDTQGVCIEISDTGEGISAENLPHIFDRFYRGDPTRNRSQGSSGLGLAIAQAILQAHKGSITAHSDGEKKGSSFYIRLP